MKRVTVRDVAAACGCSVSTVSKTLNGTDRVGEETAQRILKTASRMGYRASLSAQALAGRTKRIGVFLFKDPPEVRRLFEAGISEAVSFYSELDIGVSYYYETSESGTSLAKCFDESDAWIVTPGCLSDESEVFLSQRLDTKPLVFLQEHNAKGFCCSGEVTVDAECVGRMAAQILSMVCKSGNVGVIIGYPSWIHRKNVEGFRAFADGNNLRICEVSECYDDMTVAGEMTKKILVAHPETEGIFVTSYVSPAVCGKIRELGKDVKVVGVDMFPDSAVCLRNNELTALIFQNQKQQAFEAFKSVVDVFRGTACLSEKLIKPELIMKSNINKYGGIIV